MKNWTFWEWVFEISKIVVPGIISALLTGYWLSTRTEKLKEALQEKLTKFSIFHQQRAQIVQELFELLIDIERGLSICENYRKNKAKLQLMYMEMAPNPENVAEDNYAKQALELVENFNKLENTYRKKKIFLDEPVSGAIDGIIKNIEESVIGFMFMVFRDKGLNRNRSEEYHKLAEEILNKVNLKDITSAVALLKNDFRKILSDEKSEMIIK
jgi:hypothetical protein